MVAFLTILQVNLVMSILLYVMVLVYLYGIQATNMDNSHQQQQQQQQQQPGPDPLNSLIIQLLQADLTRGKSRGNQSQQGKSRDPETQDSLLVANTPTEERRGAVMMLNTDLLRQHKRFNSPRVLLSDRPPLQPPPLYMADDFVNGGPQGQSSGNKTRKKRYTEHRSYRGEYSVCDSESTWVTNKTEAVDLDGNTVKVLGKIKTSATRDINQYFYETRCLCEKGRCRGIDDKNWNSVCKTKQAHVRALTQDFNNRTGWRWIRINTSCVCALSRKRHRT
ncbi:neurotrophin-3 [Entelurus aequoreus]|uniref:neurotrophin-3 n=1 Tax=Entelurus aequoreus TaxID=161455 RepID=UPI002B1E2DDA|nr:neurotrophin-3 [Entelurus aequoreus]